MNFLPKKKIERKIVILITIVFFFLNVSPQKSFSTVLYTRIISDGQYALYYTTNSQQQDVLTGISKSGSESPGNYSGYYGRLGVDNKFNGQNILKGSAQEASAVNQYLQSQGSSDTYANIAYVSQNPRAAKAGAVSDQAYMNAFQQTYTSQTTRDACGGESNPDYWNCLYKKADAAGDLANNTSFNQGAENKGANVESELFFQCMPGGYSIRLNWCMAGVSYLILKAVSWLLWAAGAIFNFVLTYTVIQMRDSIKGITAINTIWTTLRDVANLFFIFILLYSAIATILRLSSFNGKVVLRNLIIVALLINFSLFFTKVIIDSSNYLSYEFYSSICSKKDALDCGLSDTFLTALQLKSIYNPPYGSGSGTDYVSNSFSGASYNGANSTNNSLRDRVWDAGAWSIIQISLLGTILIFITAVVFLAACIIFIYRFVVLIVIMIFSALAFAGMILPGTSKYTTQWWDKLISESLVAPLFFMMIWLTLKIIAGGLVISSAGGSGNLSSFATGSKAALGTVLNFVLVIGLLIASLTVTKLAGASGSKLALQTFNGVRKKTQGFIGRNSLRLAGANALNNRFDKSGTFLNRFGNTIVGDAVRRVTTGKLVAAKFGSKLSGSDASKKDKEFYDKRAKFEFNRLKDDRDNKIKSGVAGERAKKEEADRILKDARQGYQNAPAAEKELQGRGLDLAMEHQKTMAKELEAAEEHLNKTLNRNEGSLIERQQYRAEELEEGALGKVGTRKEVAKKLREASFKNKTVETVINEAESKKAVNKIFELMSKQLKMEGKIDKDIKSLKEESKDKPSPGDVGPTH